VTEQSPPECVYSRIGSVYDGELQAGTPDGHPDVPPPPQIVPSMSFQP
jgi:hypothetical protein